MTISFWTSLRSNLQPREGKVITAIMDLLALEVQASRLHRSKTVSVFAPVSDRECDANAEDDEHERGHG